MADVRIDFETMDALNAQLLSIIDELEGAVSRSEELESAIGQPYGWSGLQTKAREFEERWDEKRGELAEQLVAIQEQVQMVIDGFTEGDAEMAAALTPDS